MAYVSVPRDMTVVKSRLLLGLTTRQVVCFGIAAAVGIPTFALVNRAAGSSVAMLCLILAAFPAMVFAVYEKDGVSAEKMLLYMLRARLFFPAIRPYKVENMYVYIQKEGYLARKAEKTVGTRPTPAIKPKTGQGKQKRPPQRKKGKR
jgi:hypothetical protein